MIDTWLSILNLPRIIGPRPEALINQADDSRAPSLQMKPIDQRMFCYVPYDAVNQTPLRISDIILISKSRKDTRRTRRTLTQAQLIYVDVLGPWLDLIASYPDLPQASFLNKFYNFVYLPGHLKVLLYRLIATLVSSLMLNF